MEEFLKSLGINEPLEQDEDGMSFTVKSYDDLLRYFTILDKSNEVDDIGDDYIETDGSVMQFANDDYIITLDADFNEDIYKVKITEN